MKSTLNRVVLADYDLPRQVSLNIGRLPLFLFGVLQARFSYTCVSFKQSGLNCIMLLGNNCAQLGGTVNLLHNYRAVTIKHCQLKQQKKGKQRSIHMCLPGCLSYTGFSFLKFNESGGEWFLQHEIIDQ